LRLPRCARNDPASNCGENLFGTGQARKGSCFGGICYNDASMAKKIAILGSTGSIGKNALRVIDALGPEYTIVALSAHSSVKDLQSLIKNRL